ncbi:Dimer domain-containing protein [Artemisia annua]|uniref:Dimer domain-containing protein n=1 Tax=Artemisia annua TaxID=35608 RepID=A0A2U1NE95_ARTAN|nr:Dimer domain-containing protein [Artemisia annua]
MVKNKTITSFFKRKNEEQQVEGIDDEIQESKRQKGSTSEPEIWLKNIILRTLLSRRFDDHIVLLVEKYYPTDFTEQERNQLRCQLETFQVERIKNAKLSEVATLSDLCQTLMETGKNSMYDLVERVCRLLLTLPVLTATIERGFSAMKIFKNRLRNKMSDQNLANSMVIYIEKEIANKFDAESIIEEFKDLKANMTIRLDSLLSLSSES